MRPSYYEPTRKNIPETREAAIDAILANKIISLEFADMLIGKLLGFGASRYVFQHASHKNRVVKVDMSSWQANVLEYNVWQHVQYVKTINRWFAQCPQMSRCGRILIMEKVNMTYDVDRLPKMIPQFFTDIKPSNFGFIGKQLVCVDYASNLLMEKSMKLKMVKAKWY
jgi:hypothetical protein